MWSYTFIIVLQIFMFNSGTQELSRIKPFVINWLNIFDSCAKQMLFPNETVSKSHLVNAFRDHMKL